MTDFNFECSCSTPGHSFKIMMDNDDGTVYVYTQLSDVGFFKRIILAFNYVFGRKSKFGDGHWEETILMPSQVHELAEKLLAHVSISDKEKAGRRKLEAAIKELRQMGLPHVEDMKVKKENESN